jgi:hypothetical protein
MGAPFFTRSMKTINALTRIGTAVSKTRRCPRRSAAFAHSGIDMTVVSAATPVSAPAIE